MKLIALSLLAAAGFGLSTGVPASAPDSIPAPSWAPLDTADSLWRRGRIAVADEDWYEASQQFERLATRYPRSAYAGDALYWQAFALQRIGGSREVRQAVNALEKQKAEYPQSATFSTGESTQLLTRLNGRLARGGDAVAAEAIAELAASAAQIGMAVAAEVAPMVAAELRAAEPEIRAELARELAVARGEMSAARGEMSAAMQEARTARARARDRDSDVPPGCEGVIGDERIEALNALMQMNAEQALPILKRVLERRDRCSEILRRKAVFLVSQKRSDEAAEILVSAARNDPDAKTRSEAVFWLSQTNSARAVEVLEEIMKEPNLGEDLQKRAIFALSQTRSPRASTILRDYIRRADAPEELRGEAIFWLGQRDNESAVFLREIFPTLTSNELREKVIFAVAQRRNADNGQWLLGVAKNRQYSGEMRKSALFWAGQSGVAVRDLAEIYDTAGDDTELRGQVIFTLSQRRDDTPAVDKLLDIAKREQDRELRRQALFWLGQSRDPRVAELLEEIINKPF